MKAEYISHYLTDNDVANFARQSFGKLASQFSDEDNHKLVRFLARGMKTDDWEALITKMGLAKDFDQLRELAVYLRNIPEHWVPFGHPHITLRMQAPVPIARQAFKHKIGLVESEESRRYIKTEPEFFFPEYFRKAAANVKQGSADEPHEDNEYWMENYRSTCEAAVNNYLGAIEAGICPEQARFFLPQGTEVNWVWTGSLYAYANFYNQRSDSHAQKEIQELAKQVDEIIAPLYPVSWAALTRGEY
jgi:thymidylate synthase (FAD)